MYVDGDFQVTNEPTDDAPATTNTPYVRSPQQAPEPVFMNEEKAEPPSGHCFFGLEPPCPLFGRYRKDIDVSFEDCEISSSDREEVIQELRSACRARTQARAEAAETSTDPLWRWASSSQVKCTQYIHRMSELTQGLTSSPSPPPRLREASSCAEVEAEDAEDTLQARWMKCLDEVRSIKLGEQEDVHIENYNNLAKFIDDFAEKAKLYAQVIITEVRFLHIMLFVFT